MTINYTTLLGLAKPVTGTETGQWGDVVNDEITTLLEDAVANAATFSVTSGNVTLTTTNGSSNQARMSTLIITGSPGTTRNVIAPSQAKVYQVINQSDSSVVIKGSATTGVTIPTGATATVVWNGSDFIEVNSTSSGRIIRGNLQVTGNLQVDGNTQLGNATSDTLAVTALVNSNLLFTDNTYDIGASGATRPRSLFLGTNLTVGSLTSTRVPYASTGGLLVDSANMTFNGTRLTVADLADSGLTPTRVVFSTTGGALTDSGSFVFDGTGVGLGVTNTQGTRLAILGGTLPASAAGMTFAAGLSAGRLSSGDTNSQTGVINQFLDVSVTEISAGTTSNLTSGLVISGGSAAVNPNTIRLFTAGSAQMSLTSSLLTVTPGAIIQGLTVGRGAGAVANNTAVGASALASNTTGTSHTAVGFNALLLNTTGTDNTALGREALRSNTVASGGTAVGGYALYSNTTGNANTAVGINALFTNTTGNANTSLGWGSLQNNTTASNNTAIGHQALLNNQTGVENTAIGSQAARSTIGSNNTAVGYATLLANTTGTSNVAVGGGVTGVLLASMEANTTGSRNAALGVGALGSNTVGSNLTALGYQALYNNTTAANNTAVGYQAALANTTGEVTAVGSSALKNNSTGLGNAAFGATALELNTTGTANTALGSIHSGVIFGPLRSNTTGSANTAVGSGALTSNTTGASSVAVGYQALAGATTPNFNTAVGAQAGQNISTGLANVLVGSFAGLGGTTGNYNVLIGYNTARLLTTGTENCFVGGEAGYNVTTGSGNTFVGAINTGVGSAGYFVTTGSNNTILGAYNGNQGGLDIRTGNNYVVLSDGDGNPLVSTYANGTVALQGAVPNNGTGITFPATQAASSNANTLDDYEEGEWTPSGRSNMTVNSIITTGKYVKVGKVVTAYVYMNITTVNRNINMNGLPFNSDGYGIAFCYFGAPWAGNCYVESNASWAALDVGSVLTNASVMFAFQYIATS